MLLIFFFENERINCNHTWSSGKFFPWKTVSKLNQPNFIGSNFERSKQLWLGFATNLSTKFRLI